MNNIKINSSKSQLEDFKSSILWNDIVTELRSWKDGFEMELKTMVDDAAETNPSTAQFLLHMGDLNGRVKAVDYILGIIDIFLQLKQEEEEEKEDE